MIWSWGPGDRSKQSQLRCRLHSGLRARAAAARRLRGAMRVRTQPAAARRRIHAGTPRRSCSRAPTRGSTRAWAVGCVGARSPRVRPCSLARRTAPVGGTRPLPIRAPSADPTTTARRSPTDTARARAGSAGRRHARAITDAPATPTAAPVGSACARTQSAAVKPHRARRARAATAATASSPSMLQDAPASRSPVRPRGTSARPTPTARRDPCAVETRAGVTCASQRPAPRAGRSW